MGILEDLHRALEALQKCFGAMQSLKGGFVTSLLQKRLS